MSVVLTMEGLTEMASAMSRAARPFVCVGVVCSPKGQETLLDLYRGPPESALYPTLYGLPIYRKVGQAEPYRAFYDEEELGRYLKEDPC